MDGSNALADAIRRLADVQERDMRQREEADRRARLDSPEIAAELEAYRRPLRKMPFAVFARIPDVAMAFERVVPAAFWARMEGQIDVACPCGATPHPGSWPAPCLGVGCPRWYVYDGRDVRVAFSPSGTAPVDEPATP